MNQLNLLRQDCLKSAWARAQVLEEILQVAGLPEEETHQDQNRAAVLDPARVLAQAAESAERPALLNQPLGTAWFSDAVGEDTDVTASPSCGEKRIFEYL